MTRRMLQLHRWLGAVAGLMILIAAGTAIGLNHQDVFKRPPSEASRAAGPFGKYILSVAADPRDARHILMGTNDGLFRSIDGGRVWEEATLPVPAEQVGALTFDPRHPGRVYAAFRSIGVYRSDDGGDVWEEVALPFQPPEGTQVAGLALNAAGGLVLATTAGIYVQAGARWQHTPRPGVATAEPGKGWLQLVYDLHDGRVWGEWGVPITDAVSVALIVLVLSGYGVFIGRIVRTGLARRRVAALPQQSTAERETVKT